MDALIITFHDELNYGAALQACALCHFIQDHGIKPFFPNKSLKDFVPLQKENFTSRVKIILLNYKKRRNFRRFWKDQYNIRREINTTFDFLICGSDQIWNPRLTNGVQPYYYGHNLLCKKKIAYAASCGSTETIRPFIRDVKSYLSDFDIITVRESSTAQFFNETGIKCMTAVDPTLIVEHELWYKLAEMSLIKHRIPENYIFVYDLEGREDFVHEVNLSASKLKLPVVSLRLKEHYDNNETRFPYANPYDFLKLIMNAEYVVSNSYHALLFSYIFKKKTSIIPHSNYSERTRDFLSFFHIELGNTPIAVDFSNRNDDLLLERIHSSASLLESILYDGREQI